MFETNYKYSIDTRLIIECTNEMTHIFKNDFAVGFRNRIWIGLYYFCWKMLYYVVKSV